MLPKPPRLLHLITLLSPLLFFFLILPAQAEEDTSYKTFADYPGFSEIYGGRCDPSSRLPGSPPPETTEEGKTLLARFRPHFIIPPGGRFPIGFYEDYLPYTVLREYPGENIVSSPITPEVLNAARENKKVYLDFDFKRYRADGKDRKAGKGKTTEFSDGWQPRVYGRVYRERVNFPEDGGTLAELDLVFLKYNLVFPVSGLPKRLPFLYGGALRLIGMGPDDWHQLDNFVAVYIVLNEGHQPIAAVLAQHNHHRSYLIGHHLPLPHDSRLIFDIALRSNEIYPSLRGEKPARHRVIRWGLYLKYLLSGEDPPFFRGDDLTYGLDAGGRTFDYKLAFLSPCDPFYTAKMLLGKPRPFFSKYIGRDGPPGADYYAIPPLIAPGNLLKSAYLHEGNSEDIRFIEENFNLDEEKINLERLLEYGGRKFLRDLRMLNF